MRRNIVLVYFSLLLVTNNVHSLDIKADRDGPSDAEYVLMSGRIVPGDAERLAAFIVDYGKRTDSLARAFRIQSEGGDVAEAIKIGSLIKGLFGTIKVQGNKVCASSCFLVWMNGAFRMAGAKDFPSDAGFLAVHRPYFSDDKGRGVNAEMHGTRQVNAMKSMRSYLEENLVPRSLIDEMLSRPSNDAYLLTGKEIRMLGEIPPWFEEISIARCGYRRNLVDEIVSAGSRGNTAEAQRLRDLDDKIIGCQHSIGSEAGRTFFMKLYAGGRPWKK